MSKCKLIVNRLSGNAQRLDNTQRIIDILSEQYSEIDLVNIDANNDVKMCDEIDGYDALAVCGGDGTLNSAINAVKDKSISLIYVPCGTLNDTAKSLHLAKKLSNGKKIRRVDLGRIDDTMFAYVLAGGTFTSIGYKTKTSNKKRFKVLAYLSMVFAEYKVHHIKARITLTDNRVLEDDYTLIMVINSSRCFGFNFNKLFKHNDGRAQLLLVKAPKSDGFWGRFKIFFPMFRAFFIGLRREIDGKNMKFLTIDKAFIELADKNTFTVDGEKLTLEGGNNLEMLRQKLNLVVF